MTPPIAASSICQVLVFLEQPAVGAPFRHDRLDSPML
jgi:hypothetical protein